MADVVKPKKVHDHSIPVILFELARDMSRHVVIHFSKVLMKILVLAIANLQLSIETSLTETKKLEVPSARENVSGNSFNQVSSPYMINLPPGFSFNCVSQLS